jgi:mono/diheme cytochrome c family protein
LSEHHCQICHGLDGQNTGVPFAEKMSPQVANLAAPDIQKYTDGQLKWIIENGIRLTGMPAWKGILEDDEMWHIVRYIRHLPVKGALGIPSVFKEESEQHQQGKEHKH